MKKNNKYFRLKVKLLSISVLIILLALPVSANNFEKISNQSNINNLGKENEPPGLSVTIYSNWAIEDADFLFKAYVTDAEDDLIWINVIWGDGNTELFGPFNSGEENIFTHSYNTEGDYFIRVDAYDPPHWGEPGAFVTMPAYVRDLKLINIRGGLKIKTIIENNGDFNTQLPLWYNITHIRTQESMYLGDFETINSGEKIRIKSPNLFVGKNGLTKLEFTTGFFGLETTKYGIRFGPVIILF